MIIGGAVAGVVLVAAGAFGLARGDDEARAATASPSPTVRGDVTAWFESTAAIRGEVMAAATGVRAYIETDDGLALQPACGTLGTQAGAAQAHPAAPDAALQKLWADGAAAFAEAAEWCAKLWDGTQMAPSAILAEVTGALDTAERHWEELANRVGRPLPPLPSGTFAPLDGQSATSATATPAATPAPAPAAPAPTQTRPPGITLPTITLPTIDEPPASATPPDPPPTSAVG